MDATQQKSMRKLARIYLVVSVICFLLGASGASLGVFGKAACVLQPQLWLLTWLDANAANHFFRTIAFGLQTAVIALAFALFSISFPVWSRCFSWLFVKLERLLSHFPLPGRKLF